MSISDNPFVILLMIKILLVFLGMIMVVAPLIVLFQTTYIPWLTPALPNWLMP
ncbi:MAG: hypothetical protein NTW71_04360 [Deltaproteobacteria bacterium]|nr:hypothetical protein [Deltaproteobacteria bacterium]